MDFQVSRRIQDLLQGITKLVIEFLALQVQAGAQKLKVFESWGGELDPT